MTKEAQETTMGHRLYLSSHGSPPKKPKEAIKLLTFMVTSKQLAKANSKKEKSN